LLDPNGGGEGAIKRDEDGDWGAEEFRDEVKVAAIELRADGSETFMGEDDVFAEDDSGTTPGVAVVLTLGVAARPLGVEDPC
jgi:hypothetical protein